MKIDKVLFAIKFTYCSTNSLNDSPTASLNHRLDSFEWCSVAEGCNNIIRSQVSRWRHSAFLSTSSLNYFNAISCTKYEISNLLYQVSIIHFELLKLAWIQTARTYIALLMWWVSEVITWSLFLWAFCRDYSSISIVIDILNFMIK